MAKRKTKVKREPIILTDGGALLIKDYTYMKWALNPFRLRYSNAQKTLQYFEEYKAKNEKLYKSNVYYYDYIINRKRENMEEFKWANDLYNLLFTEKK